MLLRTLVRFGFFLGIRERVVSGEEGRGFVGRFWGGVLGGRVVREGSRSGVVKGSFAAEV